MMKKQLFEDIQTAIVEKQFDEVLKFREEAKRSGEKPTNEHYAKLGRRIVAAQLLYEMSQALDEKVE